METNAPQTTPVSTEEDKSPRPTLLLEARDGVDILLDLTADKSLEDQFARGLGSLAEGNDDFGAQDVVKHANAVRRWLGDNLSEHPTLEMVLDQVSTPPRIEFKLEGDTASMALRHNLPLNDPDALFYQLELILLEQPRMTPDQLRALGESIQAGLAKNEVELNESDPTHNKLKAILTMLERGELDLAEPEEKEKELTFQEKVLGEVIRIESLMNQSPALPVIRRAQLLAELADIETQVANNEEIVKRKTELKSDLQKLQEEVRAVDAGRLTMNKEDKEDLQIRLINAQRALDKIEDIDRMIASVRDSDQASKPRVLVHLGKIQAGEEPKENTSEEIEKKLAAMANVNPGKMTEEEYQNFVDQLKNAETFLGSRIRVCEMEKTALGDALSSDPNANYTKVSKDLEKLTSEISKYKKLLLEAKKPMQAYAEQREQEQEQATRIVDSVRNLLTSKFNLELNGPAKKEA